MTIGLFAFIEKERAASKLSLNGHIMQVDNRRGVRSLLVSSTYFPPQVGGISHFMWEVAKALGPERVTCLTGARGVGGVWEDGGFRVYRRPAAFRGTKWRQSLSLGITVLEILLRERPKVVQLSMAQEGYLGLLLRRWCGLPFVIYAHGNEVLDALRDDWAKPRAALRQASRVFAVSRCTADLLAGAGVDPTRIELVHPGCDTERFAPGEPDSKLGREILGRSTGSRVLLTVGGLVARKGHDMTIRALAKLLRQNFDVVYVIVGEGPYRGELEKLAGSLGIRDRVIFAGQVSRDRLSDFYRLSDVFVMASRERRDQCDLEGFGLVFLEAGACGKPVVAGRSGGIADAVVDGLTGLLVDPEDPDAIAYVLSRILCEDILARQLGLNSRARVEDQFTWKNVGRRVQHILDTVVEEHYPSRSEPLVQVSGEVGISQ